MRHAVHVVALTGAALGLTGCMNLSGLGGDSKYACRAPEGVTCDSVSGTYANAVHNNLPSQRKRIEAPTTPESAAPAPRVLLTANSTAPAIPEFEPTNPKDSDPSDTSALRAPARLLRLWTKPWEDADGDLHDQGYIYVRIDHGRWLIEHVQRRVREAYAPLRPPTPPATPPTAENAAADRASRPALPPRPMPPDMTPDSPPPAISSPFFAQ